MDWIQRGAVLDALQCRCEGCDSRNGALCSSCETADAIDTVEDAPGAFRWIPCAEQLPEPEMLVLICCKGTDIVMPRLGGTVGDSFRRVQNDIVRVSIGFIGSDGWYGADFCSLVIAPTYWMSLPEPPEQEPELEL